MSFWYELLKEIHASLSSSCFNIRLSLSMTLVVIIGLNSSCTSWHKYMKMKSRYPLYICGIYHTHTASLDIHCILYVVYTDYIPRRGSRWAQGTWHSESRLGPWLAWSRLGYWTWKGKSALLLDSGYVWPAAGVSGRGPAGLGPPAGTKVWKMWATWSYYCSPGLTRPRPYLG